MKPVLAFETSSSVLSVALFSGKGPVIEQAVEGFQSHVENLFPIADKLLKKKKLTIQKVDSILIGRGPGSFTGLRVGFAALKGFQTLQKRKCYGALSLDLIAEKIELPEGSILCVALDAFRDKVYSRLYKRSKGRWTAAKKPATFTVPEWAASLPAEVHLAGNAGVRYRSALEAAAAGKKIHFLPEKQGFPKASTLIELFLKDPKNLEPLETPKDFIPLYFRLSEAEERRKESTHATSC